MAITLDPDEMAWVQQHIHADDAARIAVVRQLILELHWTIDDQRFVGETWKIPPSMVARYSSMANAITLSQIKDPETLRAKLIEQMHFVTSSAMKRTKGMLTREGDVVHVADPDHRGALAGLQSIAKISGLDRLPPARPTEDYADKDLGELFALAEKKLLPEGSQKGKYDEIETEGVEAPVSSATERRGGQEHVHGGQARGPGDSDGRAERPSEKGTS